MSQPTRVDLPGRSNVRFDSKLFPATRTLGTGGEGTAELHVHRSTREHVVVKVIKMRDDDDPWPRELRRLKSFPRCNRIQGLLGHALNQPSPGQCSLLFEFCPLGDLRKWRKDQFEERNNKKVPESYIWRLFVQMAQALAFIHSGYGTGDSDWEAVIHRDIKPDNVLVISNGSTYPSFKLADFGVSKLYDPQVLESTCGTYKWQPPELPRISTFKADVWSLGSLIHYTALGEPPIESITRYKKAIRRQFAGQNPPDYDPKDPTNYWEAKVPRRVMNLNIARQDQMDRYLLDEKQDTITLYHEYSDELDEWMRRAMHYEVKKRCTVDHLIQNMIPFGREMIRKLAGKAGLVDLEIICAEKSEGNGDSAYGSEDAHESDESGDEDDDEESDEGDSDYTGK